MIIRLDDNKNPIYETAKKTPLQGVATVSVAASSTDSATVTVPTNEVWFIKSWTVTKGADITVDSITVDGDDTYRTTSITDTEAEYGVVINSETSITITGTNAALAAENLEIQVNGYKIAF